MKQPDRCCQRLSWSDLDLAPLKSLIQLAKSEDLSAGGLRNGTATPGDHSSALLDPSQTVTASLRARTALTLCGLELAPHVLAAYDSSLRFDAAARDGDTLAKGDAIGTVSGPATSLLSAERPLLNFLQKLSGVATLTRRYVDALGDSSTRLLDTRKTTPGYRVLEKYAVACGGGWNHRIGLFDRVMLKDNHLAAFGDNPRQSAIDAVSESRRRHPDILVEMEVDTLEQIEHALAAKVDIILLDNFPVPQLQQAIQLIGDQAVTEASGGITIDSLPELASLGLDFISTGATVHQSTWIDIGLDS
ncbi:carboxylating nicotinate-nucleotide diphosphorylase [Pelagicoccus sp. SDUM812005]|uniref:carboxylating nicotinate-nucleotide diphosphorylase n=1 Tax=Pelagicoccus sp. SDUM812005 TaxID=3041257 RepID=UPI00280F143B|nr:carboxylating nicotinate-nucleotide diphosphorylase [Pelagicoccus sp. SDUM812005]MDQ8183228.1 carboxylating nicotinate-nucleotide diphosphorylase [Pelagicoccus sp. SDUM812005]